MKNSTISGINSLFRIHNVSTKHSLVLLKCNYKHLDRRETDLFYPTDD